MIQTKKQLIEYLKAINEYFNWLSGNNIKNATSIGFYGVTAVAADAKKEPYQGILKNENTIPGFKKYGEK